MATIARTEEMFVGTVEAETKTHTRWDSFISLVTWVLTPMWVMDYAEELSKSNNPHLWV
jgi:hypothetical protein